MNIRTVEVEAIARIMYWSRELLIRSGERTRRIKQRPSVRIVGVRKRLRVLITLQERFIGHGERLYWDRDKSIVGRNDILNAKRESHDEHLRQRVQSLCATSSEDPVLSDTALKAIYDKEAELVRERL